MTTSFRRLLEWRFATWSAGRRLAAMTAATLMGLALHAGPAAAVPAPSCSGVPGCVEYDLTIQSLTASGVPVPFGAELGTVLADVSMSTDFAYGGVAATGKAFVTPQGPGQYLVQSFFDVFGDIRFADVDPVNDFATGNPTFVASYTGGTLAFDAVSTSPVPTISYAGFVTWGGKEAIGGEAWLTVDLSLESLSLSNPVFLAGGVVELDATAPLSGNAAITEDPPFGPLTLTGPTTATPLVAPVPEPGTILLLATGGVGLAATLIRRRRR